MFIFPRYHLLIFLQKVALSPDIHKQLNQVKLFVNSPRLVHVAAIPAHVLRPQGRWCVWLPSGVDIQLWVMWSGPQNCSCDMDAQLECSNWMGSSMGGRLWIHNQFIVYSLFWTTFWWAWGPCWLATWMPPRCSPERMFPSSQWWRCRCYIDRQRSLPKWPDTFRISEFGVRELLLTGLQVTQVTQLTMPHAISCTASTDPAVSSGSTYRLDLRLLGTVGIWQMPPVRK